MERDGAYRTLITSSSSRDWHIMASFANWALSSETYVTKATPRDWRILTVGRDKQPQVSATALHTTEGGQLTPLDVAKLLKVLLDRLGRVAALLDPPDVQRAVHPREGTDSAHVVAVVGVLLAAKDVEGRVGEGSLVGGKAVEEGAVGTGGGSWVLGKARNEGGRRSDGPIGTAPSSEEEADVGVVAAVGSGVSCVGGDVDSALRLLLAADGIAVSRWGDRGGARGMLKAGMRTRCSYHTCLLQPW